MGVAVVGIVLALAVVGSIIGIAAAIVVQRRERKDLAELSEADRQRHAAILAAEGRLSAAVHAHEGEATAARKQHDAAVRRARKELAKARHPHVLLTAGSVQVTETTVSVNGHGHPLVEGITARIESTGDLHVYRASRSTLTRTVAGGVVAGPIGAVVGAGIKKGSTRTNDTRQLFLTVTGPGWQEVTQLNPDMGLEARQFAAAIQTTSGSSTLHGARYRARVAAAQRCLDATIADTARLEAADRDTGEVEEASRARRLLGEDPLQVMRRQRRQLEDRPSQSGPHPPTGS